MDELVPFVVTVMLVLFLCSFYRTLVFVGSCFVVLVSLAFVSLEWLLIVDI